MKFDNRDKRLYEKIQFDDGHTEELVIGISPEQERDALNAIEYWKDCQASNFEDKSTEYVNYCHDQIIKIQDYIKRNTF